jgi:predicted kinase
MLIIFGGLPGVGKTTLAKAVAREWEAVYLRVDTIEQALTRFTRKSDLQNLLVNDPSCISVMRSNQVDVELHQPFDLGGFAASER